MPPGDPGYEEARRVWNGAIDRRPALIARCRDAADVVAAVRFAREQDLLVAVRGGGHNVAGTAVCDDGLVIDLSLMKELYVDPARRTVRAGPGLLWGEFDRATQLHGLAAPGGIVTHTGIAGLTLGGGIGWLMRKHGLTSDSLRAVEIVTAEGDVLSASADQDPDLWWGMQGGGGNFGIVTSFDFHLHEVGPIVLAGVVLHPAERVQEVMPFYRERVETAREELTTIVTFRHVPPLPPFPRHLHGRPVVSLGFCYAGPVDEGARVLAPFRQFGPPLLDLVRPKPYVEHQGMFDATVPHGWHYYWKSHYLPGLDDRVLAAIAEHAWEAPTKESYTIMFQMGGAIRRRTDADSAFTGRNAAYAVNINGVATAAADLPGATRWARDFWEALSVHATGGVYVNFLGSEGEERVQAAFGAEKYTRLGGLKAKYDPTNFFRVNQNIRPVL